MIDQTSAVVQTNFSFLSSLSWSNFFLGGFTIGFGVVITRFAFYIHHNLLPATFILPSSISSKMDPSFGTTFYRWVGILMALLGFFVMIGYVDLAGAAFGDGTTRRSQAPTPNTQFQGGNNIAE
jgi:hypothetical protein